MSTTVLEALQNARCNLDILGKMGAAGSPLYTIAMDQLGNAITALENGKEPDDILQEHAFDDVDTGEDQP